MNASGYPKSKNPYFYPVLNLQEAPSGSGVSQPPPAPSQPTPGSYRPSSGGENLAKIAVPVIVILVIIVALYLAYPKIAAILATKPPVVQNTTTTTSTTSTTTITHTNSTNASTTTSTTTVPSSSKFTISGCTNITQSGTYLLAGSINTQKTNGACINIKASGVVLQGKGNRITGSGPYVQVSPYSYGILLQNASNVAIYNLSLEKFSYDVFLSGASYSAVSNVTVLNATISGIYLSNSNNNTVQNSRSYGASSEPGGIVIASGKNNNLLNDTITENSYYGVRINSTGNKLVNDTIELNTIDLSCGSNANFSDSNLFINSRCGINSLCNFAHCSTTNKPASLSSVILSKSVNSCGVITSPGRYQLAGSLNMLSYVNTSNPLSQGQACIRVNVPNVQLNCNNNIISNSWYGVYASHVYNVTVSNCRFYNSTYAVYLGSSFTVNVTSSSATKGIYGFYLNNDTASSVTNSNATFNTYGAYLNLSSGITFNGMKLTNNSYGVYYASGQVNDFISSQIISNSKSDLYCSPLTYNGSYNIFRNDQCGVTDCNWGACTTHVLPPLSSFVMNKCGTISVPGNYSLNSNLLTTSSCISIKASNVVLNCNNNLIEGSGPGIAFLIENQTNVTVKNCKANSFSSGVVTGNTKLLTLSNITVRNVSSGGISLTNSNLSQVLNSQVFSFGSFGLSFARVNNSIIQNNTASSGLNTASGLLFQASNRNIIKGNTANSNPAYGFWFNNSRSNSVANNSASNNIGVDYNCQGSSSGLYAESGLINSGITKRNCIWLVETASYFNTPQCLTISLSSTISFAQDLLYTTGQTCYTVYNTNSSTANQTVINCNGHTVYAPNGGTFLNAVNSTGTTLENCYLRGFTTGVKSTAKNLILINDTIANSTYAVNLNSSLFSKVSNVYAINSSYGLYLSNSNYGTLQNNRFSDDNVSIDMVGGSGWQVDNNSANFGRIGLYMINSQINYLMANKFLNASQSGIACTQYSTNKSSNFDQGENICSSDSKCAWMTSSPQCVPH